MTEVAFYHLTRSSLEQALPKLLEKTLAAGKRAVVRAGSKQRVEFLNGQLWTHDPASWLPHGSAKDGAGEDQPVWLTARDENPNGAQVLFLTDGATSRSISGYDICVMLFDGRNEMAVEAARGHWRTLKEAGHEVTYWQQDDNGRWAQKS